MRLFEFLLVISLALSTLFFVAAEAQEDTGTSVLEPLIVAPPQENLIPGLLGDGIGIGKRQLVCDRTGYGVCTDRRRCCPLGGLCCDRGELPFVPFFNMQKLIANFFWCD